MLTILRSVNQVKDHGPWTRAVVSTCHCQSRCLDGSSCAVSKFAWVDGTLNYVAKTVEIQCLLALRNHSEDVGRIGSFWVFEDQDLSCLSEAPGAVSPLMTLGLLMDQPDFCLHLDMYDSLPLFLISSYNKVTNPIGLEPTLQLDPILTTPMITAFPNEVMFR